MSETLLSCSEFFMCVYPPSQNGLSPLHMSAQGDHVECARQLLQHKAPIDEVTVVSMTSPSSGVTRNRETCTRTTLQVVRTFGRQNA